jgi:hypothetical protein
MLFEKKNGRTLVCVVATNALEHGRAVMNDMGENVNLGVIPVDKAAVHPNLC